MLTTTIPILKEQYKLNPDRIAIIFKDEHINYGALNRKINQLAALFKQGGYGKGDVIAVSVDRSIQMVITFIAIMKAGAAYLPLDPGYPKKRLEYMLVDAQAKLLITDEKYQKSLNFPGAEILIDDIFSLLDDYPAAGSTEEPSDTDLAYILYTSGSTGLPKGVMIEHRSLRNLLTSMQEFPGITKEDRLLALTTVSFDISVLELFLPLTVGATLVLADSATAKDGTAILKAIERNGINFIQATPSSYKLMLMAGWETKYDMKVLCCGEQLPKELAEKILPRCTALFNMYGPTETTIYSTGKQITSIEDITIGRPIRNTNVVILNACQNPMPNGRTGEICIGGLGLAKGYFNNPGLTASKFISFPQNGDFEGRIYRTGDLGKILPNGEIQCFGRIDNQVKIRGYRIELGEIDYSLSHLEHIKEALASTWEGSNGDIRIIAYVSTDSIVDEKNLDSWIGAWKETLKTAIPGFMMPNDFMLIENFPLTANGKIDRKALPTPAIRLRRVAEDLELPQTELQVQLKQIWCTYLGLNNVGIHDDFFDIGGDSLSAVRVTVAIKNNTGKHLPLGALFKYKTIAELSSLMDNIKPFAFDSLVPLKPGGSKNPLYIVHGVGATVFAFLDLANRLANDQPVYGLQSRGIDGHEEPLLTIEEMASAYIKEIIKQNPDGPYLLAGYSQGGLIAFEMARQMIKMGRIVQFLGLFDSYVPKGAISSSGILARINSSISDISATLYRKFLAARPTAQHLAHEDDMDTNFKAVAKVTRANEIASLSYHLKKSDISVHYFMATKPSVVINYLRYQAWKPFVKEVFLHRIRGNHFTIFEHALNEKFARKLQNALDGTS
ncbi:non-ribosomal peptide synthetase [Pedobacter duraquae]|uniref:Amino acid adenylation domain-containing protein n=1 Tax=Pedobacter duraquae TaxID=425511 RepID=A0A4R6IPD7_9SPHI|nr:amino acid adenylation domain-containing protein [Pedobacter duraquae]TDO24047.1 amino acid adenylation domain-containing protein [Pedobacter duraquae]